MMKFASSVPVICKEGNEQNNNEIWGLWPQLSVLKHNKVTFTHAQHIKAQQLSSRIITAVKPLYLDRQGVSYDAIHRVFCEGVKVFVWSSHELRLQSVAAPTVVFKHEEIQLHGQIWNKGAKIKAGPTKGKREVTAFI